MQANRTHQGSFRLAVHARATGPSSLDVQILQEAVCDCGISARAQSIHQARDAVVAMHDPLADIGKGRQW